VKAVVYHGPQDLRLEERAVPDIGPDEVLLKVLGAGICGTDLRIYHGAHRMFSPGVVRIPGHEVAGEIAAVGTQVEQLQVGQRVFVAPNMGCGHCRQCISGNNNRCADYTAFGITMDGAFAEYMHIPATTLRQGNLIPISRSTDPAAAALIEPFACVLRGQDAVGLQTGDSVVVIGAGPIGIMHVLLARLRGASRVIVSEMLPSRLSQATAAGADLVIDPAQDDLETRVRDATRGAGADVIIVAAPAHAAQQSALRLAAIGGRINFFGGLPKDRPTIQCDSNLIHYKELHVTGTTACSTRDCWRAAELVDSGRINLAHLVSGRFPLEEFSAAFAAAEDRSSLKIVLQPFP
jgi:L-iditol 2-dehydrogenase